MSAETPWKDNTENLCEIPCICVEAYAFAWPGNSAAPRLTPRTQAWPSFLQRLESKFRHGSKPSSSQALQSPRICVEVHAYAWKLTSSAENLISPTHMRGILCICVGSRLKKGQKCLFMVFEKQYLENYIHAGCFELTLEVSDNKWPSAAELPIIWRYNKMSLLNLVASLVKVTAGKTFADYHRLLAPKDKYEGIVLLVHSEVELGNWFLKNCICRTGIYSIISDEELVSDVGKNGERKLKEQETEFWSISGQSPTPRRGTQRLGVSKSGPEQLKPTPRRGSQCLGA
ncbi:hypothetical protein PIB30_086754, partial [Stylosanthes scabra]|nr:hypothetical protein [Stylosanthes scabra]